jgi:beta-lactam-binding protein with PASTA domain
VINLQSAATVEPALAAATAGSAGCEKQVNHCEVSATADCNPEVATGTCRKRSWKWWTSIAVSVCGLALIGFLCVCFFVIKNNRPAEVLVTDSSTPANTVAAAPVPAPVIVESDFPSFDGSAFGQLDSLLLGSSGFAGSWLTGMGAIADGTYAPPRKDSHVPPTVDGQLPLGSRSVGGPDFPNVQGHTAFLINYNTPGPLSLPPTGFRKELVIVPHIVETPPQKAEEKLENYGLVAMTVNPTGEPENDLVVNCRPRPGSRVKDGSRVEIVLGGRVPDLTQGTIGGAVEALVAERFTPDYDNSVSDRHPVTHQRPPAGALLPRGESVAFVSMTRMPNVRNLSIADAERSLLHEDIAVTWWSPSYNPDRWPDDVICDQSIAPGQPVIRGTRHLVRRDVPVPKLWAGVRVPNIVGQSGEVAKRTLDELEIRYRANIEERFQGRPEKQYVAERLQDPSTSTRHIARTHLARRPPSPFQLATSDSAHAIILAQIRVPDTQPLQFREDFVRAATRPAGPEIVVGQRPQANSILCRGREMIVDVVQPVIRIEYYRRVPVQQPNQGGAGFGAGGFGGGGEQGSGQNFQGGGGGFF